MASKRRRTREEIRQLVRDFEKSGQSVSEFAKGRAIRAEHLKRWIRRERSEGPQAGLVEVKVKPTEANGGEASRNGQVEVSLRSGRLVRVPIDVDPETLKE